MTVATQGNANPWGALAGAGQEDVGAGDLRMPRLRVDGEEGVFVHSSTGAKYSEFDCIVLGVVKQRAAFHKVVDDTDKRPICKSNDFSKGFPTELENNKSRLFFPLAKAGYTQGGPLTAADFGETNGLRTINCDNCQLKEWDNTPGVKGTKGCDEVHTYVLLIMDGESLSPAAVGFKRSQLAASKAFLSSFAQMQGRPMFTAITHLSLNQLTKGRITYAVPVFRADMAMDKVYGNVQQWDALYQQYQGIREVLTQDPRPLEDADQAAAAPAAPDNSWGQAAAAEPNPWAQFSDEPAATAPVPAAPSPAPTTVPVPAAPQVAPTPSPTPAPAPAAPAPVAAPVAPPVAASAPTPPPVAPSTTAPAPAAPTAPAPAANPVVNFDDDLPF